MLVTVPLSVTVPLLGDTSSTSVFPNMRADTHCREPEAGALFRNGSTAANCMAGALIDACGLATLMPEEETESPGEVRSQRRRCLSSVDE